MLSAQYSKRTLIFRQASGTSRGVLLTKDSWYISITHNEAPHCHGLGECSLIQGLSPDDTVTFEEELRTLCNNMTLYPQWIESRGFLFPAIRFGLETALSDLAEGGKCLFGNTDFTSGSVGIPINGLVWMGDKAFMKKQIKQKIEAGYRCIKLKIGAINFEDELEIIEGIRKEFSATDLVLRLDANGAFDYLQALEKLHRLAQFQIHSIEQPIQPRQLNEMARLCAETPIPIALDEELIGIGSENQENLLREIKPAFIILKPSFLGGIAMAQKWIALAEAAHIGWWITSALESNIGLNAIAQWTYKTGSSLTQGLGTGQLFSNNIESPLEIRTGRLFYNPDLVWGKIIS